MRIVLDTNVVMSAVFFGGSPLRILEAWREGRMELVVSEDILTEYAEIADRLSARHPQVDFHPWLSFIREKATTVRVRRPYPTICEDPDDDAFIACALKANAKIICSGDHHLLQVDGHAGVEILPPRQFTMKYLSSDNVQ